MDHALAVGVADRLRHLGEALQLAVQGIGRERAAGLRAGLRDEVVPRPSRHELHGHVELVVDAADIVDRDDPRVAQPRREPGLAQEARAGVGMRGGVGQDLLERDDAIKPGIQGLPDHAHAAAPSRSSRR